MIRVRLTERDKKLKKLFAERKKLEKANRKVRRAKGLRCRLMFKVNEADNLRIMKAALKKKKTVSMFVRETVLKGLEK